MAKLALTLTLFIALFTLTGAKHHLNLPNDHSILINDPSIMLPGPGSKRMMVLPPEKPESEPGTVVGLEQNETTVTDTAEMVHEEEEKPVWPRGVDQRMMFVLRHHHRCHHPHRRPRRRPHYQISFRQFDVDRPEKEFEQTERSYGNDMQVADPEIEKRFDEGALEQDLTEIHVGGGGGRRHAPSQWVGLHFGGRSRFPDHEHGPHHHRHHHHHYHEHWEDDEHRPDEEDRSDHHREDDELRHHHDEKRPFGVGRHEVNSGGLLRQFRKFLHKIDF